MRWHKAMLWMLATVAGCRAIPVQNNPAVVAAPSYDALWETTVRVLEKYFDIAYESRYDGRIETKPLASANLLEFWRPDAVDFRERVEATLQTIRRRGFVLIQPSPAGGFAITVEIYKELEDLRQPAYATFGGGTFIPSIQPISETIVTSPISATDGWISLGRDQKLEARILHELNERLDAVTPLD